MMPLRTVQWTPWARCLTRRSRQRPAGDEVWFNDAQKSRPYALFELRLRALEGKESTTCFSVGDRDRCRTQSRIVLAMVATAAIPEAIWVCIV